MSLSAYHTARLALDAYNDWSNTTIPDWITFYRGGQIFQTGNKMSGFFGRAYVNDKSKSVVVAFRGTEPSDPGDILTDYFQFGAAQPTAQLQQANLLADRVADACAKAHYQLIGFTGHSLGGGLAALVALSRGSYAVTFNPAPIRNCITQLRDDFVASHVMNFVSGNDIVSRSNPFAGIVLSRTVGLVEVGKWVGEAIAGLVAESHALVPGVTVNVRSNTGHSMDKLTQAMSGAVFQSSPWP